MSSPRRADAVVGYVRKHRTGGVSSRGRRPCRESIQDTLRDLEDSLKERICRRSPDRVLPTRLPAQRSLVEAQNGEVGTNGAATQDSARCIVTQSLPVSVHREVEELVEPLLEPEVMYLGRGQDVRHVTYGGVVPVPDFADNRRCMESSIPRTSGEVVPLVKGDVTGRQPAVAPEVVVHIRGNTCGEREVNGPPDRDHGVVRSKTVGPRGCTRGHARFVGPQRRPPPAG